MYKAAVFWERPSWGTWAILVNSSCLLGLAGSENSPDWYKGLVHFSGTDSWEPSSRADANMVMHSALLLYGPAQRTVALWILKAKLFITGHIEVWNQNRGGHCGGSTVELRGLCIPVHPLSVNV